MLDAGCGTGDHLARLADALDAPVIGLGLDIAKEAARQAARRWPSLAFAVSNLWTEWPVRNRAADLVLNIFAPKNFGQTARVLQPGGWLAVVYPGPHHLAELGRRFDLMRQQEHKSQRYADAVRQLIGPPRPTPPKAVPVAVRACTTSPRRVMPNGRYDYRGGPTILTQACDEPHRVLGADILVDRLRQKQHLAAVVSGDVRHAGFYRASARTGILSGLFLHGLLDFRTSSRPLLGLEFRRGQVRCKIAGGEAG